MRARFSVKPFPHLVIDGLFTKKECADVLDSAAEIDLERKESDLFSLEQSDDLTKTDDTDIALAQEKILSLLPLIERRLRTRVRRLDMSAMLYRDTDHLLCHDDRLEGRKVAYIIYLTRLGRSQGGALLLRSARAPFKVASRIEPRPGRVVLFPVSTRSWHEVEEVKGKRTLRLTLGGWLYA